MDQYTIKSTTPLAFHNFFYKFSLPLGFILTFAQLAMYLEEMERFSFLHVLDITHYALHLILATISFWGLRYMLPYAWYSTMTFLAVNCLFALITVFVAYILNPAALPNTIPNLTTSCIYSFLVGLYYWKRKKLFIPAAPAPAPPKPGPYGWKGPSSAAAKPEDAPVYVSSVPEMALPEQPNSPVPCQTPTAPSASAIQTAVPGSAKQQQLCPHCGFSLDSDVGVCRFCGMGVKSESLSDTTVSL